MQGKLYVLKTDGTHTVKEIDRAPSLSTLQAAVGGYIEEVPYFDRINGEKCVVFCNEEGKLNDLPINEQATFEWVVYLTQHGLAPSDILVGDVVIITGDARLLNSL